MDYFRKYLGNQQGGQAPTGSETVERLCDRVQSSTLLEDRRDAVRALKALSRTYRLEVGSQGLHVIIHVLHSDKSDSEITGYALDTLCNVFFKDILEEEMERKDLTASPGVHFTEIFIQNAENVSLLLVLLEEYDFHVRWPAIKLLTQLLTNKTKEVQEIILTNPMAVSKIVDLLSDSREVIRNDGLLLLNQMTKNNSNIQKIVAFENAFERLLDIIVEEGCSDGGIVVEDCLRLLLNLLRNNTSNQNFFKESSYIQRLTVFFALNEQSTDQGWSAQKVINLEYMLQIVRTLVSPNNPSQQTVSCQKVMSQSGLLQLLSGILMASGVAADVLTETINTVSEVIRGSMENQNYFASVMAPSSPPKPAIVILLMSMVNDKQPFSLRCSVLYCVQSFLYKNDLGQSQIVQTLLPSSTEVTSVTAGQLLCSGLFNPDPSSNWFASVALSHAIAGNTSQKEQLLRVQLATSQGNPPVTLLQQCGNILSQSSNVQTRVGLLMLLCNWLADCTTAVTHFLHHSANIPFLISQVSSSEGDETETVIHGLGAFLLGICMLYNKDEVPSCTKASLRQIIEKRIGLETFTDKLACVAKSESYSKAAKKPQISCKQPNELFFDFQFTRMFKVLEHEVLKIVTSGDDKQSTQNATVDQHSNIVLHYKDLIREQDIKITMLQQELQDIKSQLATSSQNCAVLKDQVQQLKDQNSLLKASRSGSYGGTAVAGDLHMSGDLQAQLELKIKDIEEKSMEISRLKEELQSVNSRSLVNLHSATGDHEPSDNSSQSRLQEELAESQRKVQQRDEEVRLYRTKYEEGCRTIAELRSQLSSGLTEDGATAAVLADRNGLSARVKVLEGQVKEEQNKVQDIEQELQDARRELAEIKLANKELEEQVEDLKSDLGNSEDDKMTVQAKLESSTKEQEDLLALLTEQDNKLALYKTKLKEAGIKLSDEDSEADDGDDGNVDELDFEDDDDD